MARTQVTSYSFNPRARTVTLTGVTSPVLSQIASIRDTTINAVLYVAADADRASLSGQVLTLPQGVIPGNAHSTDSLVIWYEDSAPLPTGHLAIADVSGLQSALDAKAAATVLPKKVEVVTYSGSLSVTRPTADAVYWVGFPSTPTNAQSQDIVAGAATKKVIVEYAGVTSLLAQPYPTQNGQTPTGVTVDVIIAAGTGGGSGRRGAAGTIRGGGGGGSSGGVARGVYFPASLFGTSWGVTIGAAGAGGAAVTVNDTNGNAGGSANNAMFQTQLALVLVTGGDTGKGGTATGAAATAYAGGGPMIQGSNGTASSATGGPGTNQIYYGSGGAAGGASGGGITSANVAGAGSDGGTNPYYSGTPIGTGGVVGGAAPTGGAAVAGFPGNGSGSGAASITTAAQAGANALGYGVGGAGGGASLNGNNSGKGGDGGPGFIRLIWDYS